MINKTERAVRAVEELHAFIARVRSESRLELEDYEEIPPSSGSELDAFGASTGRPLPPEARACFERGLVRCYISGDAEYHFAHADFMSLTQIQGQLAWWADEELADQIEGEVEQGGETGSGYNMLQVKHLRFGIPLWQNENSVVVDTQNGKVGRCDGEGGPSAPICSDIGEFIEHFVAAGMFNYGGAQRQHFDRYWAIAKDLVPFSIAPEENKWLLHLDRWYQDGNLAK